MVDPRFDQIVLIVHYSVDGFWVQLIRFGRGTADLAKKTPMVNKHQPIVPWKSLGDS